MSERDLIKHFTDACVAMVAHFVVELEQRDPNFRRLVEKAMASGERLSVSLTCGDGSTTIELDTVNDYGRRNRVGTIDATAHMEGRQALPRSH
jgi:hypothetical protein